MTKQLSDAPKSAGAVVAVTLAALNGVELLCGHLTRLVRASRKFQEETEEEEDPAAVAMSSGSYHPYSSYSNGGSHGGCTQGQGYYGNNYNTRQGSGPGRRGGGNGEEVGGVQALRLLQVLVAVHRTCHVHIW